MPVEMDLPSAHQAHFDALSERTIAGTAGGKLQALSVKVDMGALDVLGDWDPMSAAFPNRDLRMQVGGSTVRFRGPGWVSTSPAAPA
jgi:hypothetical protein